jgi:hypothetical protein
VGLVAVVLGAMVQQILRLQERLTLEAVVAVAELNSQWPIEQRLQVVLELSLFATKSHRVYRRYIWEVM